MAKEMGRGKPNARRVLPIAVPPPPLPRSERRSTPQELAAMTAIITDAASRFAKARAAAEAKRRVR
jgi:hypothetical protein